MQLLIYFISLTLFIHGAVSAAISSSPSVYEAIERTSQDKCPYLGSSKLMNTIKEILQICPDLKAVEELSQVNESNVRIALCNLSYNDVLHLCSVMENNPGNTKLIELEDTNWSKSNILDVCETLSKNNIDYLEGAKPGIASIAKMLNSHLCSRLCTDLLDNVKPICSLSAHIRYITTIVSNTNETKLSSSEIEIRKPEVTLVESGPKEIPSSQGNVVTSQNNPQIFVSENIHPIGTGKDAINSFKDGDWSSDPIQSAGNKKGATSTKQTELDNSDKKVVIAQSEMSVGDSPLAAPKVPSVDSPLKQPSEDTTTDSVLRNNVENHNVNNIPTTVVQKNDPENKPKLQQNAGNSKESVHEPDKTNKPEPPPNVVLNKNPTDDKQIGTVNTNKDVETKENPVPKINIKNPKSEMGTLYETVKHIGPEDINKVVFDKLKEKLKTNEGGREGDAPPDINEEISEEDDLDVDGGNPSAGDGDVEYTNYVPKSSEVKAKAPDVPARSTEKLKPLHTDEEDRYSVSANYQNQKDDSDSYFFSYFMMFCIIFICGYVAYHNKQKILALLVEGRRGRRPSRTRRPNSANYHKLDSNLEEAVTSTCNKKAPQVIY